MKILYGISIENFIDVTNICLSQLLRNNIIVIPEGDGTREFYFTDPLIGTLKKIIIVNDNNVSEYDDKTRVAINMADNTVQSICLKNYDEKLEKIHSKLKIKYGVFDDELPEQKMAVRHLTGKEKVLEIGGNIGRNSLIISSVLEDNRNLVTLETDKTIANQLIENRDLNNFHFHVENSALSNRRLIQKGWDSMPSDTLKEGYTWVNTITLNNLKNKYNIEFDTLVLDCEGAFYYILMDMPEILNNVNLIIMENDYHDLTHKQYVDDVLLRNNFYKVYQESGGWGPCFHNFFEVWKKQRD